MEYYPLELERAPGPEGRRCEFIIISVICLSNLFHEIKLPFNRLNPWTFQNKIKADHEKTQFSEQIFCLTFQLKPIFFKIMRTF